MRIGWTRRAERIFDESVFERVIRDDTKRPARPQQGWAFAKKGFELFHLVVHGDSKGLKDLREAARARRSRIERIERRAKGRGSQRTTRRKSAPDGADGRAR